MRRETSAGAVVFHRGGSEPRYLLIYDAHGNWGFPKGHMETGESLLETARREVAEETGITVISNLGSLGEQAWEFQAGDVRVQKRCHYFLFETEREEGTPQLDEGISRIAWLDEQAAEERLTFPLGREMLRDAATRLTQTAAAQD